MLDIIETIIEVGYGIGALVAISQIPRVWQIVTSEEENTEDKEEEGEDL